MMERNGFPEDTFFTWSYSPIYDDEGRIGGLFCACTEETARVAAERERDQLVREAQDAARTLRTGSTTRPASSRCCAGRSFASRWPTRPTTGGRPPAPGRPDHRRGAARGPRPGLRRTAAEGLRHRRGFRRPRRVGGVATRARRTAVRPLRRLRLPARARRRREGCGHLRAGTRRHRAGAGRPGAGRGGPAQGRVLATLAHELRNPLAPIRQAAVVARTAGDDDRRQAWALGVIERQVGHMALLLDDLLDVSRISRGKLELRLQDVELAGIVEAAVETARPLLQAKGHELHVRLPPGPVRMRVDPVRLARVLSNLLSNAGKYTDPGGRIELEAGATGGTLVVRVRDNGIGLSAHDRSQIFEMFSQVASAMDRSEDGLGIGLALTRGLVELHGGRIDAVSEGPGKGSEFIVSLPTRTPEGAATPAESSPGAQSAGQRQRKVLLADDNADARRPWRRCWRSRGTRCRRPPTAIARWRSARSCGPTSPSSTSACRT
ncbi:HAMP domain-containing histidine kinase [Ramlibacter terrae]|uniref:histidine kinase n=1 Tax=Ramlibacter terrae TaxID=2732511 RepID=A0ABX6P1P1_9BURK|nr:HAMP domain-containing histidine kinase [Ramlibacter terrae]